MRLGVKHASGVTPRESQTETGFADTGAGQGGMHRESKTNMHTPPCVVGQDRVGCAERAGPTCTHHRVWWGSTGWDAPREQDRHAHTTVCGGAGQGGMHRESRTDVHTPPCVVGQDRVGCTERTGPTCTHHRVWRRWPVGGRWTERGAQPVNEWGGGGEREGM